MQQYLHTSATGRPPCRPQSLSVLGKQAVSILYKLKAISYKAIFKQNTKFMFGFVVKVYRFLPVKYCTITQVIHIYM